MIDEYYYEIFEYYKTLLTDKQVKYFIDYYYNNLTLQEIADNNNISRNAVHKNIKDILNKLEFYEKKLKLYNKKVRIEKIIVNLDQNIKERIKKEI